MPEKKWSLTSTVLLWLGGIGLIASIYMPWWGMDFFAPQYPEGLGVIVYPYKVEGKIDIINGLNHYIGMKDINMGAFPELGLLPYLIGGFAVLLIIGSFLKSRIYLYVLAGLFMVGGAAGIFDIASRLKMLGSELDPHAPIKVKPFAPPVYGDNKIANFITHSYFSYGSILLGVVFVLLVLVIWNERKVKAQA
ncbi:MAG TPA: hypothetical protein VJ824_02005 [Bacillota bacterium]|nr:hypothetical protein [Bacillota bacterium]